MILLYTYSEKLLTWLEIYFILHAIEAITELRTVKSIACKIIQQKQVTAFLQLVSNSLSAIEIGKIMFRSLILNIIEANK
jgi:hypothetical protein